MNETSGAALQPASYAERRWQSDVIVDLIKRYGFPYITLNPGASYRGLHDSLVNYGGNEPPMMLCQHEKIAVQIAHGYAKASGKPMAVDPAQPGRPAARLHGDLLRLSRPRADLHHRRHRPDGRGQAAPAHRLDPHRATCRATRCATTSNGTTSRRHRRRAGQLRARLFDHDDRAAGPDLHVLRRRAAGSAARTDIDAAVPPAMPAPRRRWRPIRGARRSRRQAADGRDPGAAAEYVGRRPSGFDDIVALAETTGAAVWDVNNALNFPNKHPLDCSMDKDVVQDADLILGLDCRTGRSRPTSTTASSARTRPLYPASCEMVEIGFAEVGLRKWAMDYCRMPDARLRVLGDTALAIPELTRLCRERIARTPRPRRARSPTARAAIGKRHDAAVAANGTRQSQEDWDASPITLPRLAMEVWDVIKRRGLGAHRQRPAGLGAQALGLRQALSACRAASSAPPPRSACRSASRSPIAARGASWSTSSPTAT